MGGGVREILEHYIRTLPEREDNSHIAQDLGSLLVWLLEHLGFQIEYYPYHYANETSRRTSGKGERQFGVDLLATREVDGRRTIYRFVLKRGDVAQADWNAMKPGSLPRDVSDAAGLGPDYDEKYTGQDESSSKVIIVGVFNGDLDREVIGAHVNEYERRFEESFPELDLEWWDARELAALLHDAEGLDAAFFAPSIRPFVRLVLDSVRKNHRADARDFDFDSIDHLLEEQWRATTRKKKGARLRLDYIAQTLSELALISSLLERECDTVASGNTLPTLVFIERALVFAGRLVSQRADSSSQGTVRGVKRSVKLLLRRHLEVTSKLTDRLGPLAEAADGLAGYGRAEQFDYPLRCYWTGGFIATGVLAARDLGEGEHEQALTRTLCDLIRYNPAGFGHPVLEDQLVELLVIIEALPQMTRFELCDDILTRHEHLLQLQLKVALPYSSIPAGFPPDDFALRRAVEYREDERGADSKEGIPKNQRATNLLPVVMYIAQAHPDFSKRLEREFDAIVSLPTEGMNSAFALQIWEPPDDMPEHLYSSAMTSRGAAHVLPTTEGFSKWLELCEERMTPQPDTPMSALGFPCVDRMASKHFRTLPHMGWLKQLLDEPRADSIDDLLTSSADCSASRPSTS